jgi:glycosyltransferase involved in cell wall biosynthesis
MKILWIVNSLMPDISDYMGQNTYLGQSWMIAMLAQLKVEKNIEIAVATTSNRIGNIIEETINNVTYYVLPLKSKDKNKTAWREVKNRFNPDVVHNHGTETRKGWDYIQANGSQNVVISIQGLTSIYERYYYAGISYIELLSNVTFKDVVKGSNPLQEKKNMKKCGEIERKILQSVSHIIGRTQWDKTHAWVVNPQAKYYHCDEILRDSFWKNKWSYDSCEKHSIFVTQANFTPIKGLHQIIKALPYVLREFPDTKIYVTSKNVVGRLSFNQRLRLSGYEKYISSLIKSNKLQNHIVFLGGLNEKEMNSQMLKANVFVCASSIENSPNALGEAQLLGVPCVSSFVGGIPDDIVINGETGYLYRFEEFEMLAGCICEVFNKSAVDLSALSVREIEAAQKRHNKEKNCRVQMDIYKLVAGNNSTDI